MSNEPLGIVSDAAERREKYERFAYKAPVITSDDADKIAARVERKVNSEISREVDAIIKRGIAARVKEISQVALATRAPAHMVVALVAEVTGTTVPLLLSKRRARNLAWPRHFAMWLLKEARPDMSLPQIGKVFDRDHTSIMHGVANVSSKRDGAPFRQWFADPRVRSLRRGVLGDPQSPFRSPTVQLLLAASIAQGRA